MSTGKCNTPSYNASVSGVHKPQLSTIKEASVIAQPSMMTSSHPVQMPLITPATRCLHQSTREVTIYRQSAYTWACLLFCFASPLCTCIPFRLDGMKTGDVYCQHCQVRISSNPPAKAKKAHCILTLCLLIGFTISAVLTYFYFYNQRTKQNEHF